MTAQDTVGDFFRSVEKGEVGLPRRPAPQAPPVTTTPGTEITPEMLRDSFPAPLSGSAPGLELRPDPAPLFPNRSTGWPTGRPTGRPSAPAHPAPLPPAPPVLAQPQGGKGLHAPSAASSPAPRAVSDAAAEPPSLERMVGQMLLVGFIGTELKNTSPVLNWLRRGVVGGVVLLPRNVVSPPQVRLLTAMLQQAARQERGIPALVAVEQEGGLAQTLPPSKGFDGMSAAARLGQGTVEATETAARRGGLELAALGLNLNLAPVADVNSNPLNEEIGKKFRAFSPNPAYTSLHVRAFGRGMAAANVIPCLKYFPGTGNISGMRSMAGSASFVPLSLPDMGGTWRSVELRPYADALAQGWTGAVMPALAYHRGLDALHPATLSPRMITELLRQRMGFQGVVISNDLEALAPWYTLEDAVLLAVRAGADMLFVPGQGDAAPDGAALHGVLVRLVREGRISSQRLRQSWQRIMALKQRFVYDASSMR